MTETTRSQLPRASDFDLYPQSRKQFSNSSFTSPSAEYRGCPLWAWNTRLHKPLLRKEIKALKDMGIGGFTMHARVGLDTPYLGEEFTNCAVACIAEAKRLDMKAFLYDEDRWPSGAAGGSVTRDDPSLRMLHLLFTPWRYGTPGHGPDSSISTGSAPFRGESGYLLGRYAIKLDESGYMQYRHMQNEDNHQPSDVLQPGEVIWYAYVESSPPSSWYNGAWYVDTMSPRAMKAFLDSTHELYYRTKGIGDEFGKSVTAIFTDEPQFSGMVQFDTAKELKDCFAPWTEGLQDSFKMDTGLDIVEALPELFWDIERERRGGSPPDSISLVRYKYHDHVAELFTSAFLDQLSEWCEAHNIAQMGHMMEEPTLIQQTQCLGEAMRTYRSMQIPGVDMLVDSREYNTVKQCSSVVRQYGRTGCMSELYGVTNWTFDFKGYKGQGDWQAALGVTLRSHHLSWVSMNGEAKRDYPAQFGYQSPWYKEYSFVESHFARVAVAMSRGKSKTRVAVLHPIESFWLRYGCKETGKEQGLQDEWFSRLTEWLLFGLIDFDFISESLLPELCGTELNDSRLQVGQSVYDVVILPQLLTIRSTTLSILERFVENGGKVIVAGRDPVYVDATSSDRFAALKVDRTNFTKTSILQQLKRYRDLDIIDKRSKQRVHDLLYQWREDGDGESFLFIANTDREHQVATTVHVAFDGARAWDHIEVLDTLSGDIWSLAAHVSKSSNAVSFDWVFEGCSTLLLRLSHTSQNPITDHSSWNSSQQVSCLIRTRDQDRPEWKNSKHISSPTKTTLSEPNCLLLDFCRYRIDLEPNWSALDEILRIDDQVRDDLKMHRRGDAMAQPWITPRPRPDPKHKVYLQYYFTTKVALKRIELAIEGAEITTVRLDGIHIPITDTTQHWVDSSITRFPLPQITAGTHEIVLEVPFDELNTSLERIYLLGDFHVSLDSSAPKGEMATITDTTLKGLDFGDYARQGLPFYTGNVEYSFTLTGTDRRTAIQVPKLGVNPVIAVSIDGKKVGQIALQPYLLDLGLLEDGKEYAVTVTVFGTRDHAFGAIHVPKGTLGVFGPGAWRTGGEQWSDGYTIHAMGLLGGIDVLVADA
ncbi:protein of unknown function [Taphrina deformans PYCC 5710]|uniref:Glycoside hydrolase family 2 protein n=1 Tax=Taphrina deformans (strain PYCC 5710 / ATCC 11124 / CBS 356.35 / IMI 108563 / JCM 9778 / NBRC 8474) TaxID=1097556 RepID=R4X7C6_TAPDE|nr:protein of unknown function [Taphrina deformans PYCC 5710]|eukprot:CCG80983.1 protein of unknown function [Taphrina deformans PYCC 5710]